MPLEIDLGVEGPSFDSPTFSTTGAASGRPIFVVEEAEQRPFERFSEDLFGFLGGGISTAAQAQRAFGRRGYRAPPPQPAAISPTVLLLAGGAVVLALALRK